MRLLPEAEEDAADNYCFFDKNAVIEYSYKGALKRVCLTFSGADVLRDNMATWNSRGLRGSALEELINRTNERYLRQKLCIIQKIPTPITPIEMDTTSRHITLAYFEKKSTVDYIGMVQGVGVAFDAKECRNLSFPLRNIHEHQVEFMTAFEANGGVCFLLIYFLKEDIYYYMRYSQMMEFWERMQNGGKKSFAIKELDEEFFFSSPNGMWIPYLDMLQKDLELRD